MKYAKKRDDNHRQIVQALRAQGCFVQDMGAVGQGVADLLVGFRGYWHVIEVKDGSKPQCQRTLTLEQQRWLRDIKNESPVHVVETVKQALEVVSSKVCPHAIHSRVSDEFMSASTKDDLRRIIEHTAACSRLVEVRQ